MNPNLPNNSSRVIGNAVYPDVVRLSLPEQRGQLLDHLPLVVRVVRQLGEGILHRHLELDGGSDGGRLHHFYYEAVVSALLARVFGDLKW